MRHLFSSIVILALAACGDSSSSGISPGNAGVEDGSKDLASAKKTAPPTKDVDPFTLICEGFYNFDESEGRHSFRITFDLRKSEAYMTDWRVFGPGRNGVISWSNIMSSMNNEVRQVSKIEGDDIWVGGITLSLRTGKFEDNTRTSDGLCKKTTFVPIPKSILE